MVDRVLITPTRVAVSLPTKNVNTAGALDLIFDSNAAGYGNVFMTGTITANQGTISFGRTMPIVPVVWAAARIGSTNEWDMAGLVENTHASTVGIDVAATTTNVSFYTDGTYSTIRYIVFNVGV